MGGGDRAWRWKATESSKAPKWLREVDGASQSREGGSCGEEVDREARKRQWGGGRCGRGGGGVMAWVRGAGASRHRRLGERSARKQGRKEDTPAHMASRSRSQAKSSSASNSVHLGGVTGVRIENSYPSGWCCIATTVSLVPSSCLEGSFLLVMGTTIQLSAPRASHISCAVRAALMAERLASLPRGMRIFWASKAYPASRRTSLCSSRALWKFM